MLERFSRHRVQQVTQFYDVPNPKMLFHQSESPLPVTFRRANGEPAVCPVSAAISNAAYDAVRVRPGDLPFTPDRVKAALRARS